MFMHPLGLAAVILLPLLHIVGCEISSDLYLTWKIAVHTRGSASNNCHYFGFFTEFLGLSSALIKAMPNTRLVYANCSEVFYASMFKEEATSMRALSIPRDASTREVFVYHGTTCDIFPKDRSKDSSIRIGRYMFEKDDYLQVKKRSPQKRDLDRIFGCSRRMDEIWIPSEFQRPIFARHVPNSKICEMSIKFRRYVQITLIHVFVLSCCSRSCRYIIVRSVFGSIESKSDEKFE